MMWDDAIPDDGVNFLPDGCSNAVTDEAAPTLTNVTTSDSIAHRMGPGPVNLLQVTSAMGRGPDDCNDDEPGHRLDDTQAADARIQVKTSDGLGLEDLRGTQS